MKILYDHQIFSFQEFGGVSRVYYELIKGIRKTKHEVIIEGRFSNNLYLNELKNDVLKVLPEVSFSRKNILIYYLNRVFGEKLVKKGDYDILHPTYYHPYFIKELGNKPYVITVYDMIHELFTDYFNKDKNRTLESKKISIKNANHIISISENTKNDLVKLYDIPKDKITVVHLGSSFDKIFPKKMSGLPKKYLLFVGNRSGYKNFLPFVKAIAPLLKKNKSHSLLCAGSKSFNTKELNLFRKLGILNKVKHVGFKDDRELAFLYKNAVVHVLPSLYEGFGLTILEAFSMGCPVVASKISSIPEVAGDAACYIDPQKEKSIRDSVEKVIEDRQLRTKLIIMGSKRVKKFTWKKVVNETIDVYQKVISNQ